MRSIFRAMIFLSCTLVIWSCNKGNSLTVRSSDALLTEVVGAGGDSLGITSAMWFTLFKYDDQKRLIAIVDSGRNPLTTLSTIITYDEHGPTGYAQEQAGNILSSFIFEYDQNGRINHQIQTSPIHYVLNHTYTYDNKGRLASDSIFSQIENEASKFEACKWFKYDDNNNNLIEWGEIDHDLYGNTVDSSVMNSTYDSHVSSFGNVNSLFYFVNNQPTLLCNSLSNTNPLEIDYSYGGKDTYTYTYLDNGLPESVQIGSFRTNPDYIDSAQFEFMYK
jgi:hypothetical protein